MKSRRKFKKNIIKSFDCLCNFDDGVFAFKTFLEVSFRKIAEKKTQNLACSKDFTKSRGKIVVSLV